MRESTIVLTFDDGRPSVVSDVLPIMQAAGMRGTAYVSSSLIGTAGYMGWSDLLTLDAAGWDIGDHTDNHSTTQAMSTVDWMVHADNGRAAILAHGMTRGDGHLAYPQGYHDGAAMAALAQAGYKTARTGDYAVVRPTNLMDICNVQPLDVNHDLANVQARIIAGVAEHNVAFPFGHELNDNPAGEQWWTTSFQDLVDWIKPRYRVLTISEFYTAWLAERGTRQSCVTVPSVLTEGAVTRYWPDAAMKAQLSADDPLFAAQDAVTDLGYWRWPWTDHA